MKKSRTDHFSGSLLIFFLQSRLSVTFNETSLNLFKRPCWYSNELNNSKLEVIAIVKNVSTWVNLVNQLWTSAFGAEDTQQEINE